MHNENEAQRYRMGSTLNLVQASHSKSLEVWSRCLTCAARLGVVIASPTRGRVSLRADAVGGCLLDILTMQVAGGGSKDGWCRKITVDGVDMQLNCVVSGFFRQGCVPKLLHGEIDIDVAAAFYSGCMLGVPQSYRGCFYRDGCALGLAGRVDIGVILQLCCEFRQL